MKRSAIAFYFLLAAGLPGCPAFNSALRAAAQALPWLVDLIADILGKEDYQARLDEQAAEHGEATVADAARQVWRRQTTAPQGRAAALIQPPRDLLRADRAELWLRRRGMKP